MIAELEKFAKTAKEKSSEKIAEQIRKIVEKRGEISYQIIMLLTKEKMERGYTKDYTLKELQEKLPWKKSTTIERLQEEVEKGVLKHEKKRYKLNKENELVKRIWNYYHETGHNKNEKMRRVWEKIQRKKELEKRIVEKEEAEGKYRKNTKREDEELYCEIKEELIATNEPKETVKKYLLKNKEKVMGFTERE
ncbi:MAG: hypothetical protein ACTSSB_05330 [Candidatus Heimdallarchaeota archaeon]